jgi:hypothetical protein
MFAFSLKLHYTSVNLHGFIVIPANLSKHIITIFTVTFECGAPEENHLIL